MKKLFVCLLALMMLLSLAACGGKGEDPHSSSVDAPPTGSGQIQQPGSSSGDAEKDDPEAGTQTPDEKDFTVPEISDADRISDLTITTMKMSKAVYASGEPITVTLKWTGTPDPSAWVGIIPADVPHGDEYVNDDADIAYIYLMDHEGSQFVFDDELADALAPGLYTIRVNETDGGGPELAWCPFAVAGIGSAN